MKRTNQIGAIIAAIVILACFFFAFYHAGKASVYKNRWEYYQRTEALLDSICNWQDSFMDTVMETDTYYEYEVAREDLE